MFRLLPHLRCSASLLLPLLLVFSAVCTAAETSPAIRAEDIAPPTTSATASGPSVTVGPDGIVWLTWLERDSAATALRCATLEATGKKWTPARTLASAPDLYAGNSDFPAFTAGANGSATAVWYVSNPPSAATAHLHHGSGYRAYFSRTADGGKTWSAPALVSQESDATEFFSLATLADGRVLAAWLDGRAKKTGGKNQLLYSRILGTDGPDTLVDRSVCDCCQTSVAAFPDGTALLVYRGRSDEEVRDLRVTRFRGGEWDEPHPLNNDDWRVPGCPVNGPQIANDGGRVAVAWFTGADNDPRVLASFSPDAGARFLMPLRLNDAKTAGRVATLLLHDGAILVTHVDGEGGLMLRRINPDFAATDPVTLATPAQGRIKGFPRMALRRDYTGGKIPAQLVTAFVREGIPGVHTLLVSVPEGDLLEAEKNCDCSPTAEQLQGFSIRGTILAAQPGRGGLRVRHFEVPGIFAEGEREFNVAPEVFGKIGDPGHQFLGRVEKRDGAWWLFDVRLIAMPPTK